MTTPLHIRSRERVSLDAVPVDTDELQALINSYLARQNDAQASRRSNELADFPTTRVDLEDFLIEVGKQVEVSIGGAHDASKAYKVTAERSHPEIARAAYISIGSQHALDAYVVNNPRYDESRHALTCVYNTTSKRLTQLMQQQPNGPQSFALD